jgi:hypothetical protein
MLCPLCLCKSTIMIDNIKSKKLSYLYRKMLGVNFSYLFKGDLEYFECTECKLK